jgi:hypothetical protein
MTVNSRPKRGNQEIQRYGSSNPENCRSTPSSVDAGRYTKNPDNTLSFDMIMTSGNELRCPAVNCNFLLALIACQAASNGLSLF